jgi:SAM-dependent methyltransferase
MTVDSQRMDERSFQTQKAQSSRDVLAFYDAYAPSWDERFGDSPTTRAFHRMRLDSLLALARFRPSDRAVELGVGTGAYLDDIAPKVRELVCVDGSRGMLDVLEAKHAHLPNLRVTQLDLEQPAAPELAADVVYCFGLLEHIIDTRTFLDNCRRMLVPGGRLIIVAPNGESPWYGAMRRLCRAGSHCTSDRYYSKAACAALLEPHGFRYEAAKYWGYAPAGIPPFAYGLLTAIGRVVDRTPLRRFAGGLTIAFTRC